MLFLKGGNPFIQMDIIKEKGIYNSIKSYEGIMIGTSAGAMNMSKYVIITPCSEEYPNFDIREGFNLSDISIFPHVNVDFISNVIKLNEYESVNKKDLESVSLSYDKFYLIQDNPTLSFIREEKGTIEFLGGTIFKVEKGTINKL